MPTKKYQGELTAEEYQSLDQMRRRGTQGARKLIRARILLNAAAGLSDEERAPEGTPGCRPVSARVSGLRPPGWPRLRNGRGQGENAA